MRRPPKRAAASRKPKRSLAQVARLRLGLVGVVVAGLFCAMFARLYYLQVLNSPTYSQLAVRNQVRTVIDPPPRGLILDRAGQPLVQNHTTEAITLSRQVAVQHPEVVPRLARVLHMSPKAVTNALDNNQFGPYRPVPIATNVAKSVAIYLSEHQSGFPGVSTQVLAQRQYPYGETAAQLLGYLGPINQQELAHENGKGYQAGDLVGQSGAEASYERWLRGRSGQTKLAVDRLGQVVGTLGQKPPTPGGNVQLTLDLGLQQALQGYLAGQIHKVRGQYIPQAKAYAAAPAGAAVVLDPQNGSVLAAASYPSYNPSVWVGGISNSEYHALALDPANNDPLLNRVTQGLYAPGSTFKLATATAALDKGLITPSYVYDDTGVFKIPNCRGGNCDPHNDSHEALGPLDLTTAIAKSDDVFFYNLGYMFYADQARYGATPIQDTAHAYGLGVSTGVNLPYESTGRIDSFAERQKLHALAPGVYPPATWYSSDQVQMAFGQGETVITPLQLANAYATFANGGTRYQPRLAADVLSPSGKVMKSFPPVVAGHVPMSAQDRQAMLDGFIGAVQGQGTASGTFRGFDFSKMQVAGKTGTASTNHPVPDSLFVAFAGKDVHHPQYVVAVVIEQAGYGANDSAPVARQALQYLMDHPPAPVTHPKPAPALTPLVPPPPTTTTTTTTTTTVPATTATTAPPPATTATTALPPATTATTAPPPATTSTTTPPPATSTTVPPPTTSSTAPPPTSSTTAPTTSTTAAKRPTSTTARAT
ncbi:MAG: penicillin-binding protein 2, partial [Acidimicrobiales bacterium]